MRVTLFSMLMCHLVTSVVGSERTVFAAPSLPTITVLLWHDSPNDRKALEGLRIGLSAMGLEESMRVFEANEDEAAARSMLARCSEDGTRLIVTLGTRATQIAKDVVKDVPIVFTAVTHPVLSGLVEGWGPSGTNLCGNSNWLDRLVMLETFKRGLPELKKLLVITTEGCAVSDAEANEASDVARNLEGIEVVRLDLGEPIDLEKQLPPRLDDVDAVWVPIDIKLYGTDQFRHIVRICDERRVPIVSTSEKCAGAGALIVLTVDYETLGLRASSLVKSILEDKKEAGSLPIGRTASSRIYVDLGAARKIGLEVPLDLVLQAYRIFGGGR